MKLTRETIEAHKDNYAWLSDLSIVINSIESNLIDNPDISIESCKALLESISNTILKLLDPTFIKDDKLVFHSLFKKANEKLLSYEIEAEEDILQRAQSFLQAIAQIRNQRGDISHGKVLPKEFRSSVPLAKFIKSTTDGIASYVLYLLCNILDSEPVVNTDNPDFNDYLDINLDVGELTGQRPSYILFTVDPVSYFDKLDQYLVSRMVN